MDAVGSPRHAAGIQLPAEAEAPPRELATPPADARPLRILVVDADRTMCASCVRILDGDGYDVTPTSRPERALHLLERQAFDIVVLDLPTSDDPGLDLLRSVRARRPEAVIIAMSAHPTVHSSVAALGCGAFEFLPKPFSAAHLQLAVGRAAHDLITAREGRVPRTERDPHDPLVGEFDLLGVSEPIRKVIDLARRVAATDASVFITGESGTGKERMANFIHHHSRRRGRPLVAINCAAMPETLIETEMFGHRKGAFTGAVEDKRGLLEAANGGTFFLDELMQMPLGTQAKLLRVVQDGVVRRVGSDAVNAVVNVRFIAATNEPPEGGIRTGRLREDLYYRLRVFPLHLPPLRERREDIGPLADHFLRLFWSRHRGDDAVPRFSESAKRALAEHPWRGNVRELQNVIEHGVVLFEAGMVIQPEDIPFALHAETTREIEPQIELSFLDEDPRELGFHACRERLLARFERRYLAWVMERAGGNLSKAARIAGVQRTTLYRLMEKHEVHRRLIVPAWEQHRS